MSKLTIVKGRTNQLYERKEAYLPHEVLDFLPNPSDYPKFFKLKKIRKDYDGDSMKMGSERYYTFAKSLKCEYCLIEGTIFYKERSLDKKGNPQEGGYHFNLYAFNENNEEILMTKDHIIARSHSGKDELSNYVTCCEDCNIEKNIMSYKEFKKLKREELSTDKPKRKGMGIGIWN